MTPYSLEWLRAAWRCRGCITQGSGMARSRPLRALQAATTRDTQPDGQAVLVVGPRDAEQSFEAEVVGWRAAMAAARLCRRVSGPPRLFDAEHGRALRAYHARELEDES